jgi:hypothetical protein
VDFVDKGANPGALITLAKRHKENDMAENEAVAKRLADAEAATEALTKRLDEAEAKAVAAEAKAQETEVLAKAAESALAEEIAKRELVEVEAIAKTVVLPGVKTEEKVTVVGKWRKALGNDFPVLEGVLKALAIADKTSEIFKELGSDNKDTTEKSPLDRLNQMADELVAKGTYKSRAVALDAVLKSNEGKTEYAKYHAAQTRGGK